ncbi:MAG: hypothetical protein AAF725_22415, partial [Acidobacteriota bacterium]
RFFEESDRRRAIGSSAFETEWMDRLAEEASGAPVLFVSEASTLYFSAEENRRLYSDLARRFPGSEAIFDTASGSFVDQQDQHDALRHCAARVSWVVERRSDLESWDLEILERFSLFRPAADLRRLAPWPLKLRMLLLRVLQPAILEMYKINRVRLGG